MIIAFSGCSGAGKSALLTKLRASPVLEGYVIKTKPEDTFILLSIAKGFFGRQKTDSFNAARMVKTKEVQTNLAQKIVMCCYASAIYFEFLLDYIYYEVLFKRKVLLKDRYIYDYLITFKNNLRFTNKVVFFLFNYFPKPYLLFYIRINEKTALHRNKNPQEEKITSDVAFHKSVITDYDNIAVVKKLITIQNDFDLISSLNNVLYHFINKEKFLATKSMVLTGLDGSGKTTVARLFTEYLDQLNIKWVIAHFYHDNLLYKLLKKVGYYKNAKDDDTDYEQRRTHNVNAKKQGRSFLWAVLHFTDSYIQYFYFSIFYAGRYIIYDRYFYDFLVSFAFLNVPNREIFEKLIIPVKNRFLLVCPPEIMYQRKPETTLEFAKEHFEFYKRIADKFNLVQIDSHKNTPNAVLAELIDRIN